jgi:aminoglycoside phosphotransferase (APT) family kinase protein
MDINELAKADREVRRKAFIETLKSNLTLILHLVESFSPTPTNCSSTGFISGAYNFCIRLRLESGTKWIIRFPLPSEVNNVEEKMSAEVATMKLVASKCPEIPIPKVISYGVFGPGELEGVYFLIMEELEGRSLDTVWHTLKEETVLRKKIFSQLGEILLHLSRLKFNEIGSLHTTDTNVSKVRSYTGLFLITML